MPCRLLCLMLMDSKSSLPQHILFNYHKLCGSTTLACGEMAIAATIILCSVLFLCALTPASMADYASECSEQNVTEYLTSTLTQECAESLESLEMRMLSMDPSDSFIPSSSDLDRACTAGCAGAYAGWLRGQCGDPFTARMLEGMCVFTADTATAGQRCRFAFPDAIENLRGEFEAIMACGIGMSDSSCLHACDAAMNSLIDRIGCCYQSLYNNTEFLHWLINDMSVVEAVEHLGRAPEWNLCVADLPPKCEMIERTVFSPPTTPRPSSAIGQYSIVTFNIILLAVLVSVVQ